jgi:23S rRNA (cytosine1962-C5)-methyltransferase
MAFEPFLVPWPEDRILCVDRDFLVIDKLWGLPVHGGREDLDDIVARLSKWLVTKGESPYLAVHQRLDQGASGVLLFVRNPDLNPVIGQAFEQHRIDRRYVAVVADHRLPDEAVMIDRMNVPTRGPSSIVQTGGVRAEASLRVMARSSGRALVELRPKTGRRHQLRLQLAHRKCPIVGDVLYGGQPGHRLMLHATELEVLELQRRFSAAPPAEFQNWHIAEGLGDSTRIRQALADASHRRAPYFASVTTAFRLVNDAGDGLRGVRLDRYGDFAVLELASAESHERRGELVQAVIGMGALGVYVKCRARADVRSQSAEQFAPNHPDLGQPAPEAIVVEEAGLRFEVSLSDGWDTGLYIDQRSNRQRVFQLAAGKNVLNLFCYTGSFTVAAAKGGAQSTTSVDISRRALGRAQRNLGLNGLESSESNRLLRADVVKFVNRAVTRGDRYDLIILDPPSFATSSRTRVFRLESEWQTLIESVVALLSPGGQCLFVSHEVPARARLLRGKVKQACEHAGLTLRALRDLPSGSDCPDQPEGPYPSRSVWLELE